MSTLLLSVWNHIAWYWLTCVLHSGWLTCSVICRPAFLFREMWFINYSCTCTPWACNTYTMFGDGSWTFTVVGRILFAPFRLYSDKVLQATCSCTCGHVDSSFFATLNFFEALPTLPTLPPSSFIYCRPWRWQLQQWFRDSGIIYARNTIIISDHWC